MSIMPIALSVERNLDWSVTVETTLRNTNKQKEIQKRIVI
jgi:hypothetical protein